MSTPASISCVAAVWRSMRGVTRVEIPAAAAAFVSLDRMAGGVSGSKCWLKRRCGWVSPREPRTSRKALVRPVIQSFVRKTCRSWRPLPVSLTARPTRSMSRQRRPTTSWTRTPVATIRATARRVVDARGCSRSAVGSTTSSASMRAASLRKLRRRSRSVSVNARGRRRDRPRERLAPIHGSSCTRASESIQRQKLRSAEARRLIEAGDSPAVFWVSRKETSDSLSISATSTRGPTCRSKTREVSFVSPDGVGREVFSRVKPADIPRAHRAELQPDSSN